MNFQLGKKISKCSRRESFCKNVGWLFLSINVLCCDKLLDDCITDKMAIRLNVFSAFMEDRVGSNIDGRFTIAEQAHRLIMTNSEGRKKLFDPLKLL